MASPRALITGIGGQDGSYLAELLLSKGYEVWGIVQPEAGEDNAATLTENPRLRILRGDLTTGEWVDRVLAEFEPDEVYHLAAQTHVGDSFEMPVYTGLVTGLGTAKMIEAVRRRPVPPKFYQASSSELFGSASPPQSEQTRMEPRSPYACAKLYAYHMVKTYRDAYGLFAVNGILFNHESPRRGETFVTRKVTKAVAEIKAGRRQKLYLGTLDTYRDWGYAPEYVVGIWKLMQLGEPRDVVLGTGRSRSVKDFVAEAFRYAGLNWKDHVRIDNSIARPLEVPFLCADPSLAKELIGWEPQRGFQDIVQLMVDADLAQLR